MKSTLKSILEFHAQNPSEIVFIKDPNNIIAKEFLNDITLANHLDIILNNNSKVALSIDDIYLFCCTWIACQFLGKTTIMLPNNKSGTIIKLATHYDSLITDNDLDLSAKIINEYTLKDCETIFFTSGSTGEYKGYSKTIYNLEQESSAINSVIQSFSLKKINVLTTVSHQHLYGFSWAIVWPLLYQKIIHTERLFVPELIHKKLLQDNNILITTPVIISHLEGNITTPITNSLLISSASALSTDIAIKFQNSYNIPILEAYGSSETGVIAYRQQLIDRLWKPFDNVCITTESDQLVVRSLFFKQKKQLMSDIVALYNDKFELKGRVDKIVKIAGNRLSISQMQNILIDYDLIQDCVCIKRQSYREYIAAIICLNQAGQDLLQNFGKQNLIKQIKSYLLNYYSNVVIPKQWRFVTEIPTNSQGKRTLERLVELLDDN
ncbi:AMP-binding protein [Francisella orientalis]|uniref:AMP-binding protein n=1 Tax=Francisella orientalis TaxID=299583 RepID=UPI0011EBE9BC|nr:AMP-binding protein [Francisella orientalis]QEN27130.1 Acyl-CoA synthetase, AMP-(fatty) acid ligase [Francisella orientalis]